MKNIKIIRNLSLLEGAKSFIVVGSEVGPTSIRHYPMTGQVIVSPDDLISISYRDTHPEKRW